MVVCDASELSALNAAMRSNDFRRIALALRGVVEGDQFGMVKLTPDQQRRVIRDHPEIFTAENGAWGRAGSTRVRLESAHEEVIGEALTLAWQNSVNKPNAKRPKPKRLRSPIRRSGKH
jgi:hypothetical protein